MQPSPEIQEVVMRNLRDMATRNAQAMLDSCSREPGVVFIGTAPTEWMENLAELEAVARPAIEGGSGEMPADIQIQTGQEGTMGWAAYRYTVSLPNGRTFVLRASDVWHQEGGTWKCVHSHLSVGVPDDLVPSIAQPA